MPRAGRTPSCRNGAGQTGWKDRRTDPVARPSSHVQQEAAWASARERGSEPACPAAGSVAWDEFLKPWHGPWHDFPSRRQKYRRPCRAGGAVASTATGRAVDPGRCRGLERRPSARAWGAPLHGPCGVGLSGRGHRRPHHTTGKDLPSFPRPVTSTCLLCPRALSPSVPSSSPGLTCETLTLVCPDWLLVVQHVSYMF